MKIGFVGMGKLGFPCALAVADRGHNVVGYDTGEAAYQILASRMYPHREVGAQELLEETPLRMVEDIVELVKHSEIVLVAVQTPHRPEFEGLDRMPDHRADFDYGALKAAVVAVAGAAEGLQKRVVVDIISTCLPGTYEREIKPLLNEWVSVVYTPYFIAMGTTIADFLKPEFVLVGRGEAWATDLVQRFYRTISDAKHRVMSITSAELTKVFYNVFLGLKIVAANSGMEIAHKTGANIDDVTDALALATDRVVSAKYMRGGMGDGGGCHPRDQIALSWLAQKLDLSFDLYGAMIKAREQQTEWLAYLALEEALKADIKDVVVLGKAYKKGTNLTLGSPAILLKKILDEFVDNQQWGGRIHQWDPHVDGGTSYRVCDIGQSASGWRPAVYIVGIDHDEFFVPSLYLEPRSVVVDPWGKFADREGIKVIRVGRREEVPAAG